MLLVTGIVMGLWTAHLRARKVGRLDPERVVDFDLGRPLGLAGSKLLLVVTEPGWMSPRCRVSRACSAPAVCSTAG